MLTVSREQITGIVIDPSYGATAEIQMQHAERVWLLGQAGECRICFYNFT